LASPTINIPTNVPGIRTFRPLEIRDANGCKRDLSGITPLTVEILAMPDATITTSNSGVCKAGTTPSIVFTGSLGTPSYLFEYDINGNNQTPVSSNSAQTHTLNAPTSVDGIFTYKLNAVSYTVGTTTCKKPLSATVTITVHPLPVASLNTPATNIQVCKDDAKPQFSFNGTSGTAPYTFEYTRNGSALTASGVTHLEKVNTNIAENIQYRLIGISDANGCRQTATGSVDVEVAPIPVVNAGPNIWIMSGQDALLNANASNAMGMTYQWSPPMFVDDPTKLQPLARPLSTTTFTIKATSNKGCSNSSSVLVTVLFQPEIPNTFTPNNDGANDRWEIKNLESYPNAVVEVYNTAGQVVFKNTGFYTPWDGTRNGRQLPIGTYYYVIHTRFNNVKRSGFITLLR
jgi:gliding motility-associated-like protein